MTGTEAIKVTDYIYLSRSSEFRYGNGLREVFRKDKGFLKSLINFGEGAFISKDNSIVFVDNYGILYSFKFISIISEIIQKIRQTERYW